MNRNPSVRVSALRVLSGHDRMGEVPHHGVVKLRGDETALTLEVLLALPQKGIRLLAVMADRFAERYAWHSY
ncbi:hypothetical protein G6F22_022127 [Rhizopus arrhizus]|nr:hypothetical protein G6F22_022127 [Rhizopus arrhizus]